MATVPDVKLQLPARRRQEKAAVQGQEQGERDQLARSQSGNRDCQRDSMTSQVPVAEPGLENEAIGEAPPESDKPVVILEAIRPVHQDHFVGFIRQVWKKQQRWWQRHARKWLTDRRPPEDQGHISGEVEAQEQRSSPTEAQEQSLVRRESRGQKLSLGEAGEKSLGVAELGEQSLGPAEALEWRLSPKETEERSLELSESQQWEKSTGEAQEQNGKPVEPQEQTSGGCEIECRLSPGESKTEQRLIQRKSMKNWGLLKIQRCRLSPRGFPEPSSGVIEAAEMRLNPGESGEKSSRQMEGQKWTLKSGKALKQSLGRPEAPEQKPVSSGSGDKKLGLLGVEAGEGRTEAAEEEAGDRSKMVSSVTKPLPPMEVVTRNSGLQHHLPPSVSPLPPALPSPQLAGLTSHLFCGIKSGSRVGAPHHSGHCLTVSPRQCRPPAASGLRKKRYPTAEEILVLGGYLRLNRSCLAKKSPERRHKQLNISFKESALETIYYYSPENSVLEKLDLQPEA